MDRHYVNVMRASQSEVLAINRKINGNKIAALLIFNSASLKFTDEMVI